MQEKRAREQGVPDWAIESIRRAQTLIEKVAASSDLAEAYEAQVKMALRTQRGIHRASMLELLEQLEALAQDRREVEG